MLKNNIYITKYDIFIKINYIYIYNFYLVLHMTLKFIIPNNGNLISYPEIIYLNSSHIIWYKNIIYYKLNIIWNLPYYYLKFYIIYKYIIGLSYQ